LLVYRGRDTRVNYIGREGDMKKQNKVVFTGVFTKKINP
jgi:hypothetical protein